MRSLGWVLIQSDLCPYKRRRAGHRRAQRDDPLRTQGETVIAKQGEHARAWMPDLQPLERETIHFCCLGPRLGDCGLSRPRHYSALNSRSETVTRGGKRAGTRHAVNKMLPQV